MKTNNKKIYAIIAIVVVAVMVLVPILSLITSVFSSGNTTAQIDEESVDNGETIDVKDEVTDETALKIIDMHENLDNYKDKEVSMELQYFLLDNYKDKFSLGAVDSFKGEKMLFNILAETEDNKIPEGFENYDKVKVTGIIKSFNENHDEHEHNVPIITVKSMEKIDKEQEEKDS